MVFTWLKRKTFLPRNNLFLAEQKLLPSENIFMQLKLWLEKYTVIMCIVAKWCKISVASAGISEQVNASGVSLRLIMGVWEIVLKSIGYSFWCIVLHCGAINWFPWLTNFAAILIQYFQYVWRILMR